MTKHGAHLFKADPMGSWKTAGCSLRPGTRGVLAGDFVKAGAVCWGVTFTLSHKIIVFGKKNVSVTNAPAE